MAAANPPAQDVAGPLARSGQRRSTPAAEAKPVAAPRLSELAIEVGGAAGNHIDACVLAQIYLSVDRLRIDPNDPLGWAGLLEAGDALDNY
jgi:hypothetical protein